MHASKEAAMLISTLALLVASSTLSGVGPIAPNIGFSVDPATSRLVREDCLPPCACPTSGINVPMFGKLTLVESSRTPTSVTYRVIGADFQPQLITPVVQRYDGYGTYTITGVPATSHRLEMTIVALDLGGRPQFHLDSGDVPLPAITTVPPHAVRIVATSEIVVCRRLTLEINAPRSAIVCYPNCDGSSTLPTSNPGDFACFLQRFAAGDPYANCDASTIAPVLNAGDFACFLERFRAGCSAIP
jgi:hypothetical protein